LKEDFKIEEIKAAGGKNDFTSTTYKGVHADLEVSKLLEVVPGMTKRTLEEVMKGHILAKGQLVGTFSQ
jgi:phosphatidylethanolamine-binding protein (PEBP) family uncharacterized protein